MINKHQKRKNNLIFLVYSFPVWIVICCVFMIMIPILSPVNAETTLSSNYNNKTLQFQLYVNKDENITIQYPTNWEKGKGNFSENIITFRPAKVNPLNNISAGVGLFVYDLPYKNVPSQIFNQLFIDSLKKNFSIETNITTILNNYPAHEVIFVDNKTGIKGMHIWTINYDKSYIISYITNIQQFSKYLPIVIEMIKSFKFEIY